MKKLYRWQKVVIWVIGILTLISVTYNDIGKELNVGYFFDLISAIGLNILVLWLLFTAGNWIYKKYHDKPNIENRNF